jgi:phage head maturation protease
MRLYAPITKIDEEQRMVWGYASTEARDDQGEVVKKDALAAALPEYLKLGNIREMHQLSAVGKAKEAAVDEKGLVLGAKWEKVTEGVYNGFSIGGRVTSRDKSDRTIIDGIQLTKISIVDRPANPEALFDVWKASLNGIERTEDMKPGLATLGDTPAGQTLAAVASTDQVSDAAKTTGAALAEPVQIWACGDNAHTHASKADAVRCIEKRAAAGENGGTQWEPKPDGAPAVDLKVNTEGAEVDETAGKSASVAELPAQPQVGAEAATNDAAKSDTGVESGGAQPEAVVGADAEKAASGEARALERRKPPPARQSAPRTGRRKPLRCRPRPIRLSRKRSRSPSGPARR